MLQLFQQQSEKAPRELEHLAVDLKRKIKMVINRGIPKWRLRDYTWTIQKNRILLRSMVCYDIIYLYKVVQSMLQNFENNTKLFELPNLYHL